MSRSSEELVTRIEKQIMTGRGRWVADFNESFRSFKFGDVTFDAMIRGNTRMKGFLLSRLFSFFLNPNYEVALFIQTISPEGRLERKHLHRVLVAVKSFMEKEAIKWSWLVIIGRGLHDNTRRTIEDISDNSMGVVYIDSESRELVNSNSYLGKQARKYLRV